MMPWWAWILLVLSLLDLLFVFLLLRAGRPKAAAVRRFRKILLGYQSQIITAEEARELLLKELAPPPQKGNCKKRPIRTE